MMPKCSPKPETRVIYLWIILIVLSLPEDRKCIIPEASQEDSLHPLRTYSDITMLHYTVPKEVLSATWQFATTTDNENCEQRTVYVYLKWGSYPVIPIDNGSFPDNTYLQDDDTFLITTVTSFQSKITAVQTIYGPEPGDWFVAAYLLPWDETVQQQGLLHHCKYSIGSITTWNQKDNITNIPIGEQKTLTTTGTATYYKIFIPSGTWNFYVRIWNCYFGFPLPNVNKSCITGLSLKGRSLPVFNQTHPNEIKNFTSEVSYTFTESSPYEDSYYYLLVVSESAIKFNVKITVLECPIKLLKQPTVMPPLGSNTTNISNRAVKLFTNTSNDDFEKTCVPRFELVRVKHAKTFSTGYLSQGRDWLISWVQLSDLYPTIIQFHVLPWIDVGGTLDIHVELKINGKLMEQLIMIMICMKYGKIPDRSQNSILCHDKKMLLTLSTQDKHVANLSIPYPNSGTYYIALQAKCYENNKQVTCGTEEMVVSLDVHSRPCVFSGPHSCGDHGICEEIHRGILFYSACHCFEGYTGWGCTDSITANSYKLILSTLLLTLSNAFFLPAILLAIKRKLFTEGLVYTVTMLSSSLYHICDQHVTTCLAKYEVLQFCDFFSSILSLWMTLVAMAQLPPYLASCFHMLGVFIIAFGVVSNKTNLTNIVIPLISGIMMLIATYTLKSLKAKKWQMPEKMFTPLIGSLLAGSGLLIFCLMETKSNYSYIHSLWHVVIAIALLFLLPSKSKLDQPSFATISTSAEDKLFNFENTHDNQTFDVGNDREDTLVIA